MSCGKPHQSQDLQTWSCGLLARPRRVHHVSDDFLPCLGLCTTAHVSLTLWHVVGPAVAATACG